MVVMSKVMGNNKHLHYLQKYGDFLLNSNGEQLQMPRNAYVWVRWLWQVGVWENVCVTACVQVCALAHVATLSPRKYIYRLLICFLSFCVDYMHQ